MLHIHCVRHRQEAYQGRVPGGEDLRGDPEHPALREQERSRPGLDASHVVPRRGGGYVIYQRRGGGALRLGPPALQQAEQPVVAFRIRLGTSQEQQAE